MHVRQLKGRSTRGCVPGWRGQQQPRHEQQQYPALEEQQQHWSMRVLHTGYVWMDSESVWHTEHILCRPACGWMPSWYVLHCDLPQDPSMSRAVALAIAPVLQPHGSPAGLCLPLTTISCAPTRNANCVLPQVSNMNTKPSGVECCMFLHLRRAACMECD